MPLQSTMTSKGQVTVPVEIRRRLGLRQGDRVEFSEKGSDTVIRRAPDSKNPFERYKGALKGPQRSSLLYRTEFLLQSNCTHLKPRRWNFGLASFSEPPSVDHFRFNR
jgi:antitoxin PrlF